MKRRTAADTDVIRLDIVRPKPSQVLVHPLHVWTARRDGAVNLMARMAIESDLMLGITTLSAEGRTLVQARTDQTNCTVIVHAALPETFASALGGGPLSEVVAIAHTGDPVVDEDVAALRIAGARFLAGGREGAGHPDPGDNSPRLFLRLEPAIWRPLGPPDPDRTIRFRIEQSFRR